MIWRARVQSSRFARAIILGELPRCWRERNAKRPDQSEEGRGGEEVCGLWGGEGRVGILSQSGTEGNRVVNRQLCSRPFILRETASFLL